MALPLLVLTQAMDESGPFSCGCPWSMTPFGPPRDMDDMSGIAGGRGYVLFPLVTWTTLSTACKYDGSDL